LTVPVTSLGTLTVANGSLLRLGADCAFSAVTIGGVPLIAGSNYTAATLVAMFPTNVVAGGSGSLTVLQPAFGTPVISATNLVLAGGGGPPGGSYRLLSATNIALPLPNWTPVLSNTFGGDGSFSNAIGIEPSNALQFYRLSMP
jgi:hypothetical protein